MNKIALWRLFAPRLSLEGGFVFLAVSSHTVWHQLRLPNPAESPHNKRAGASVGAGSIPAELYLDLVVQEGSRDIDLNWLERRV